MAGAVKDVDKGYKALMKRVLGASNLVLTVGIQDEKATEPHAQSGLTNAELGTIHEFGAKNVPERSFIRATVDDKKQYVDVIRQLALLVVDGKANVPQALGILGEKVVSDIRTKIENKIPPPLDKKTIARKGSSTPLIDTGQLKNSITWRVKRSDGEK